MQIGKECRMDALRHNSLSNISISFIGTYLLLYQKDSIVGSEMYCRLTRLSSSHHDGPDALSNSSVSFRDFPVSSIVENISISDAPVYLGPVSTRDNRVWKGPLGRSLRSFARTAHSAHSLRSAPLRSARFARSLRSQARSLTLLSPSWDS